LYLIICWLIALPVGIICATPGIGNVFSRYWVSWMFESMYGTAFDDILYALNNYFTLCIILLTAFINIVIIVHLIRLVSF
jgi:hypothetical protein